MQRQLAQSPHVIEVVADQASWNVGGGYGSRTVCVPPGGPSRSERDDRDTHVGWRSPSERRWRHRPRRCRTVDTRLGHGVHGRRLLSPTRSSSGTTATATSSNAFTEARRRRRALAPLRSISRPIRHPACRSDGTPRHAGRSPRSDEDGPRAVPGAPGACHRPARLKKARPDLARIRPCFGTRLRGKEYP